MRKPVIVANWKMNNTVADTLKFAARFTNELKATGQVEVAIAPPFTALYSLGIALAETDFKLAAQNLFFEDGGAYTGEISGTFLSEVGCKYAIVGHSERRQYFGDTDEVVNKKLIAAIRNGLIPIMCVGELLPQRESGKTWDVIESQLSHGLNGIDMKTLEDFIIAYEPVWAIGTGKTATPEQAEEVHVLIRKFLTEKYGPTTSDRLRIIYGGSVKAANSRNLMVQKNIDGALVGGASLDPIEFSEIVRSAH